MAGQSTSALEVIRAATGRAAFIDGGSTVTPTLERLRGWALLQGGDAEGAEGTWLATLAAARGRRDRFETALTLDGLVTLYGSQDRELAHLAEERDGLMGQLGIIRMPRVPTTDPRPRRASGQRKLSEGDRPVPLVTSRVGVYLSVVSAWCRPCRPTGTAF